jgi:hypothetical protein
MNSLFILRHFAAGLVLLLGVTAQPASAKLVQQVIKVPVTVNDAWGKEVSREVVVTVFVEDSTPTPRPILIINHGRAPESENAPAWGAPHPSPTRAGLRRWASSWRFPPV